MATRVVLNNTQGMRLHSKAPSLLSDDDDGVQSGSATGFSDDMDDAAATAQSLQNSRTAMKPNTSLAYDPVTQILDKIDAELSSLTRSQASSSTATDSTVVRRPPSHISSEASSRLDNGDSLTLSQLGSTNKPTYSPLSSGSRVPGGSTDRDTGIGTGTSSLTTDSRRSRSVDDRPVRDLEPGDNFKGSHGRSLSPDFSYMNGHHVGQSDDDKSKRENQTGSPFESKHVDDKFKEIMQKRKGGFLNRAPTDDDNQTIRTEDFVDKFQDTMVYSSADEAEKIRNLEEDLHSDGGWDTDTLQQKLATLTRTPFPAVKDGRSSPCPLPRPLDRPRRKVTQSLDSKPRKAGGPGTPPVYPKPTPTSSLPRPSTRSPLKFTPGHTSDADSVRTEDFENRFKDMMVQGNNTAESDLDAANSDPIHTRVKQLLKATAKYEDKPTLHTTTSILKSRYRTLSDKPKPEIKPKPHVTISPKPPQYQDEDKGDDSDDTLISDKDARVPSPRSWSGLFWKPNNAHGPLFGNDWSVGGPTADGARPGYHSQVSNSSSLDESLSKSSRSLSQSSVSSSDKEKPSTQHRYSDSSSGGKYTVKGNNVYKINFSRQASQLSSAESASSYSDYPETSAENSRSASTSESPADDWDHHYPPGYLRGWDRNFYFPGYQTSQFSGALRRRSIGENLMPSPYGHKKFGNDSMKIEKRISKKPRDLIVQDDEEEEYPFSKYTFNKRSNGSRSDDSSSNKSSVSQRSTSRDSICSTGVMNQLLHLKKGGKRLLNSSSSNSLFSSLTSSINDTSGSSEDYIGFNEGNTHDFRQRQPSFPKHQRSNGALFPQNSVQQDASMGMQQSFSGSQYGHSSPGYVSPNPAYQPSVEHVLSNLGFNDAQSFLPKRFLKSWMDKIYHQQQEELSRQMPPPLAPRPLYQDQYSYTDDQDLPPSVSAQQSGSSTPQWRTSFDAHPGAPNEAVARAKRHQLQRANTINSSGHFSQSGSFGRNNIPSLDNPSTDMYSSIAPLPLQKENSFDKLKRILQSTDKVHYRDRDSKRSAFSSNRQKSLPLFLETLSEEEEERRRSRTPSFELSRVPGTIPKSMSSREDHEDGSRSSNDNSDASRRSSLNPNVADILKSVKKSLSTIGSDSESSSHYTGSLSDVHQNRSNSESEFKPTIPCILVSDRLTDKNKTAKHDTDVLCDSEAAKLTKSKPNTELHGREQISRPKSPSPNHPLDESAGVSKDSLEIEEIFSPKDKRVPTISVLTKIDSFNEDGGNRPEVNTTPHLKQNESNNYLKISDVGDKYFSPTPSTASPISPITVIEMNRLDNLNDSIEQEEHYRHACSCVYSGGSASVPTADNRSSSSGKDGKQDKTGSPRQKSNSPHSVRSLVLERRSYTADPNSDSDRNLSEENLDIDEDTRTGAKSVQAELQELTPLINLSDASSILRFLLRKLPQQTAELDDNVIYLAQDREVQCDLVTEKAQTVHNETTHVTQLSSVSVITIPRTVDATSQTTATGPDIPTICSMCSSEDHTISPHTQLSVEQYMGQTKSVDNNIYMSQFTFILQPQSAEKNELKTAANRVQGTHSETSEKDETIMNGTSKLDFEHEICKVVTVTSEDMDTGKETPDEDETQQVETRGFQDMIKSYMSYCKQGISETTGELKSPNSLTVERFEYEPWDAVDLQRVVSVLDNEEISIDVHKEETESEQRNTPRHVSHIYLNGQEVVDHVGGQIFPLQDLKIEEVSKGTKPHSSCESALNESTDQKSSSHSRLSAGCQQNQNLQNQSLFQNHMDGLIARPNSEMKHSVECDYSFKSDLAETCEDGNISAATNRMQKTSRSQESHANTSQLVPLPMKEKYTSSATIVLQSMSDMGLSEVKHKDEAGFSDYTKSTMNVDLNNSTITNRRGESKAYKRQNYTSMAYLNLRPVDSRSTMKKIVPEQDANHDKCETTQESTTSLDVNLKRLNAKHVYNQGPSVGTCHLKCVPSQISEESTSTSCSTRTICNSSKSSKTLSDTHTIENLASSDEQAYGELETHKEETSADVKLFNSSHPAALKGSVTSPEDIIADKLSSRSLDFDTFDTRRHILKRSHRTTFSRSFDLVGSLSDSEATDSNKHHDRSLKSSTEDNMVEMEADSSVASHDDNHSHESEGMIPASDQGISQTFRDENIQYQLGLKYDDDGNCVDVYGRLRVIKSDSESNDEENTCADVNFDSSSETVAKSTQHLRQNVFDIFAQIDVDEEGGKVQCETDKTLKELEKLYKMSVDDDYICQDRTYRLNVSENGMAGRRQSYSSILEELDEEMKQMEVYHQRFQYYETHICRNCDHSVTIATTEMVEGHVEHDFCRECSPLDLTAEMLEQRRIEKMQKGSQASQDCDLPEEVFNPTSLGY